MTLPRLILPALLIALPAASALAVEPELAARLPLKPEIRKVLDNSCVFCHGEVIDGKKETRGDVDLSSDEAIKETVTEIGRFKQYILEDKMPNKPKLSRRLRENTALQDRLTKLKADYEKNGEKAVLLAWLEGVTATTGEKKKDH
ncbi:MAG: hypothetical protein ABUL61_05010 [Oleiharenicola lentus]